MARIRLAWFTPLEPVESGISLYSQDILPALSRVAEIDVIVDGYRPTRLNETDGLRVRSRGDFDPECYDLIVYQMGNSTIHLYMLEHVERSPGLLVLHDTVLNHLMIQRAVQAGTLDVYQTEMERKYGSDAGHTAERVLKGQMSADLFNFPMSEELIAKSRATLVHSEHARQQVLNRAPEARVERVPFGLSLPQQVEREVARAELGLPLDQFTIASITHINPYKRIDVVLRALRRLRRQIPARLVLAGSVSPNMPLNGMIAHLNLDDVVDVLGYVEDREARLLAAAADVIVNLRYPTAGETSASLLHSMAAGRPVLVSRTGSFGEVPEGVVISIPVDELEESMLVAVLNRLARDHDLRASIGSGSRSFIAVEHSLQRWVDGYVAIIGELMGIPIESPGIAAQEIPVQVGETDRSTAGDHALIVEVARDVAELGLGGDDTLLGHIARDVVELGLGVGKMTAESNSARED